MLEKENTLSPLIPDFIIFHFILKESGNVPSCISGNENENWNLFFFYICLVHIFLTEFFWVLKQSEHDSSNETSLADIEILTLLNPRPLVSADKSESFCHDLVG